MMGVPALRILVVIGAPDLDVGAGLRQRVAHQVLQSLVRLNPSDAGNTHIFRGKPA
jgi:hypothetical protein